MDLANNYATALDISAKNNADVAKAYCSSLENLGEFFKKNQKILHVLSSGIFGPDARVMICEAIAKKLGFSVKFTNFLRVLARGGRVNLIADIHNKYLDLLLEKNNQAKCYVTSANKLSKADEEKIKKVMKNKFGYDFILEMKIDKSLVSGIVARYKSFILNASLENILLNFEKQFIEKASQKLLNI